MKTKTIKALSAIVISVMMVFLLSSCGSGEKATDIKKNTDETNVENSKPAATLFLASDYQEEEGWSAPQDSLKNIMNAALADEKKLDEVIICGDYTNDRNLHDYQLSPEDSIKTIENVVTTECPKLTKKDILFVQGNHDQFTESISESGPHEYDDYIVYVVNTENDFPWKQGVVSGSLGKVRKTSEEMKSYFDQLISNQETRPVIIAGHVPLHFSGRTSSLHTTGDNMYSSLLFEVVNDAALSLDIIYLVGHNHTKGWDCYLGQSCIYKTAGDTILIPEFSDHDMCMDEYTEEKLNFTYLNAGYLGHCMNCSPDEIDNGTAGQYEAADNTLTGTVCEIYSDTIVLTRYSTNGVHQLGSAGCASPYYDDTGLIPSDYYSEETKSPQVITRHLEK